MIAFSLHLFFVVTIGCLKYSRGADTIELVSGNIQSLLLDSSSVWVVELGDPSEFKLAELDGAVEKLSKSGVSVGTCDCTEKTNAKICRTHGFNGQYTIKIFSGLPEINPYTKKNFRSFTTFEGKLTVKAIESSASKNVPNLFKKITNKEELEDRVISNVNVTVIAVTEKDSLSLSLKTVVLPFKSARVNFVHVLGGSSELLELLKITAVPAIGIYSNWTYYAFDGDLKDRVAISQWLSSQVPSSESTPASEEKLSGKESVVNLKHLFPITAEFPADVGLVVAVVQKSASDEIKEWPGSEAGEGSIRVVELRCSDESSEHADFELMCGKERVLPYLAVLPYGATERKKVSTMLSKWIFDTNSIGAAIKKAGETLPEIAIALLTESQMENFLLEGHKQGLVSVFVLSEKEKPPISLRNVAVSSRKFAQIGYITTTISSSTLFDKFGLKSRTLPAVLGSFYHPGKAVSDDKTTWEEGPDAQKSESGAGFRILSYDPEYLGPIKYSSLQSFVYTVHQSSGYSHRSDVKQASTDGAGSPRVQTEVSIISSESVWNSQCGSSFKGICTIAFLDAPTDASAAGSYSVDPQGVAVLENVMKNVSKDTGNTFHFFAANIACLSDFARAFGVDPFNVPTVAIYSPVKQRYAVMKGSYNVASVRRYLDEILRGAVTFPMPSPPTISSDVDCTKDPVGSLEEQTGSNDGDADDFLAEIRREEEARAAQLKKELEEDRKKAADAEKSKKKQSTKKKTSTKKSSKKEEL